MKTKKDAKSKGTILIADYDFGDVNIERAIIEGAGFEILAAQCKSEDEVIEHGREADGVLAQYAPIGARAINAFTRCRVIARYGTGVDIVDVDAATRRGIQVTNAPNEWCAEEVADHAVALWLAATRKICEYDRAVRRGEWRWQTGHPIWRIRGRVFGLVSFGAIARSIAERVRPFGVDIWAYDPFLDPTDMQQQNVRAVSFDRLIEAADYLVIQAPLTPETRHLFNRVTLRRMKPTAILINTARGPIVEDASQRHHHTARRILLGGLDWRRAPDRSRRGRTCVERPSRPLACQHDRCLSTPAWILARLSPFGGDGTHCPTGV